MEKELDLKSDFCVDNLQNALEINLPEIHNSDQGVQFTDKITLEYWKSKKLESAWMEEADAWIISSPRDYGEL